MSRELKTIEVDDFNESVAADADLDAHVDNTSNPHSVNASQVGSPSIAQFNAHTSDTTNPHVVTKTTVGLSNVENTALSTWAGSNQINTVGTITNGVWNGSPIDQSYLDLSNLDIENLTLKSDFSIYSDYEGDTIPDLIFHVDEIQRSTYIGNISHGNYSKIEPDGTLIFEGDAVVWDDLRFPAVSFGLGSANDPGFAQYKTDGATSRGVYIYFFDSGTEEELFLAIQLSHKYKFGTDICPHVHFIVPTNGAAGQFVKWGFEYTLAKIGDTFGNTTTIYTDASSAATATLSGDASLIADKHYVAEFPDIDGSGIDDVSTMILARIFRDAGDGDDDYPNDAGLLEFDLHYQIDTIGSRSEYIK